MKLNLSGMLDRMAEFVLEHGLTQATLRPLARAAGTSDRMLIYHFGSKDGVIGALLDHLAARFTVILDGVPLPSQACPGALVQAVLPLLHSPLGRPYAQLFLEVVAGAARDEMAYRAAAARILVHFRGWIAARLPATDGAGEAAAYALGMIEGLLVLSTAGDEGAALVADALAGMQGAPGETDA